MREYDMDKKVKVIQEIFMYVLSSHGYNDKKMIHKTDSRGENRNKNKYLLISHSIGIYGAETN